MKKYRHFKSSEFDSPDEPGSGENMDMAFMDRLHKARVIADMPFVINSGYRTKAHNKEVGGKKNSSHLRGLAADIHCADSSARIRIVASLVQAGFRRIGIGETFIHVDSDTEKPWAAWLY